MLRQVVSFSALTIAVVAGLTMSGEVSPLTRIVGWATTPNTEETGHIAMANTPDAPSGRRVALEATRDGHFLGEFRINGRPVNAMVDTGATVVAMNVSTARRAGIKLNNADFRHPVETANGRVMAAAARLDSIEIGRISVRDVEALVIDDGALNNVLVGMSFLRRLKRYEAENHRLLLIQ